MQYDGRADPAPRRSAGASTYPPETVRVVDYDPDWPQRYAEEANLLSDALGAYLLAVEHIGSTAIPGMPAKPVIDILAATPGYAPFDEVVRRLARIGYLYTPESEVDDPGRRVFRKGPDDLGCLRTHHLHVTEFYSHYWQRMVAFRDHLRGHPEDAASYVDLKRELVARHPQDSRRYTAGKHQFVTAIEQEVVCASGGGGVGCRC